MNPDPGHGLLQILSFSTVFANGHYEYTSAVSSALCVWQQFELVCDDPRNIVLMMHPSLCLEDQKRDEEVCK